MNTNLQRNLEQPTHFRSITDVRSHLSRHGTFPVVSDVSPAKFLGLVCHVDVVFILRSPNKRSPSRAAPLLLMRPGTGTTYVLSMYSFFSHQVAAAPAASAEDHHAHNLRIRMTPSPPLSSTAAARDLVCAAQEGSDIVGGQGRATMSTTGHSRSRGSAEVPSSSRGGPAAATVASLPVDLAQTKLFLLLFLLFTATSRTSTWQSHLLTTKRS